MSNNPDSPINQAGKHASKQTSDQSINQSINHAATQLINKHLSIRGTFTIGLQT